MNLLRILLFIISIIISDFLNLYYIDSLLDIFSIMSFFALIANRVAIALFIYFFIDMVFLSKKYNFKEIINKLFFIYSIWLMGMLFGRFSNANENIISNFNFNSFLPKWIHHLSNPLVSYYIFGNIIVFIPLGMYVRYNYKIFRSITISVLLIIVFELIQAISLLGFFDIDDIFLNGIGVILGVLIMSLLTFI